MFQLLLTLAMVSIVFWVLWVPLGGKHLFAKLIRDEQDVLRELEESLAEAEDELDSLPRLSADEPETRTYLREHLQGRIRQLNGKVERAKTHAH